MKSIFNRYLTASFLGCLFMVKLTAQPLYHEQYRPQLHFSPAEKWTNDPNGMFFYKGLYHLFFQYYPDSTVWGPMHWGHAVSPDLVHWEQKPIALYPDSMGYIFSGSAVVDYNNSSGFAKKGEVPVVAIYTNHNPKAAEEKRNDAENQHIAYSLDGGNTWIKYSGNPVLKNPGIKDFRDPKVMWYEAGKKWMMTLATQDRISFYSSPDLKNWKKESEFGQNLGAHGGVWECPDLFPLNDQGKTIWVLVVNLNPGGPNGGSATQYFTGSFNGHAFTPSGTRTKWLDYGPDEYAGITWSNTGNRKIFLGWMSNWQYANLVPTVKWRNAMTIPRDLAIAHAGGETYVRSLLIPELRRLESKAVTAASITVSHEFDLAAKAGTISLPGKLNLSLPQKKDFSLELFNDANEKLIIGYDSRLNQYYIDRTAAGQSSFQKSFAARHTAPRLSTQAGLNLTLVLDHSAAELFADNGLTVMTETFFPGTPYNHALIKTAGPVLFSEIRYAPLASIWP